MALTTGQPLVEIYLSTELPKLKLVPAPAELSGADVELQGLEGRETRLQELLEPVKGYFDYILIDCPPSLSLLTVNALVASDSVLVPLQCEYFALEGISRFMMTHRRVRSYINPNLGVEGILLTMYDDRTNLGKQVADEIREHFGDLVYRTVIPRNVRLGEAPSHGKPIFLYDTKCAGASAYLSFTKEFLDHEEKGARPRSRRAHS